MPTHPDQTPHDGANHLPEGHVPWTAVILGLAALVGVWVLTLPMLAMMLMAADSCRSRDDLPICDPRNQTLVLLLPTAAMLTGVLLIALGGGTAVRHRRKTFPWQVTAWLLLITAWIASIAILTADQAAAH